VTLTVADAGRVIDRSEGDQAVLVHDGLAVGEVDHELLQGHADHVLLLDILRPVPSTVRPSVTVASVVESGEGEQLVTASDGRLLGLAIVPGDHDHDGHDHEGHEGHEGHDHGGSPVDDEHYEKELAEVMEAIQERFGEREPSAEELRAFLHGRLTAEGRSVEEADRYLDEIEMAPNADPDGG